MTHPRGRVYFSMKRRAAPIPPEVPCVFSGKMRFAFNAIVNSYDTRPTAPRLRIFFQLKRALQKPFQFPCVFSMKVRLACKVNVNVHAHSLSFSKEHAPRRNPAAFLGFTSLVFSQAIRVLRCEMIVNLHVMRPTAH